MADIDSIPTVTPGWGIKPKPERMPNPNQKQPKHRKKQPQRKSREDGPPSIDEYA